MITRRMYTPGKEVVIQPVRETEEWPIKQICFLCQQKAADQKITVYGHPDRIPRVNRYCNYCIETEFPQFQTEETAIGTGTGV